MSETLKKLSDAYASVDWEVDLIVLGQMALYRAKYDAKCPVRHWMGDATTEPLRIGAHRYRFGHHRDLVDGQYTNGLRVRVDLNHYHGSSEFVELFFPYDALADVATSIRGRMLDQSKKEASLAL